MITGLTNLKLIIGGVANGASLLYNNVIKKLSLVSGTTTFELGVGTTIRANNYVTLTESTDNKNIIIDSNSSYLNTTTSLSSLFYTQASTNSILSSYQSFISTNSNLTLSKITCSSSINVGNSTGIASLNIKGINSTTVPSILIQSGNPSNTLTSLFMVGSYSDVVVSPGNWIGGVSVQNLGTIPLINGNLRQSTSALTPSVIKALTPQEATNSAPIQTNYGLNVASCKTALSGLVVSINGQQCISVDGILALLVANMQHIYTNLKAAGVSGFTTY